MNTNTALFLLSLITIFLFISIVIIGRAVRRIYDALGNIMDSNDYFSKKLYEIERDLTDGNYR